MKLTDGAVLVSIIDGDEKLYSEKMACVNCKINIATLEPRSFSFNSRFGYCRRCEGVGTIAEVDPKRLIPDTSLPANKLPLIDEIDNAASSYFRAGIIGLIKEYNKKKKTKIRIDKAFKDLPEQIRIDFFEGVKGRVPIKMYRRTSRQALERRDKHYAKPYA